MKKIFLLLTLLGFSGAASAALLYNDRLTFESALSSSITDTYQDPAYSFINTDAEMSAVLGETQYTSTGFSDLNLVTGGAGGDMSYCSGCNGSFLLDFTSTSVGDSSGVFGVGFDVTSAQNVFGTYAYITFGNGTTENFLLPDANADTGDYFWGVTDELMISSIHFGLIDGGTNTNNSIQRMALDDLTIGGSASVPEPSTMFLFAIGLLGMAVSVKKRLV